MISHLLSPILNLHGLPAYALVACLAFGEAAILLGFVIPGETAVILGGVLASRGQVSLVAMLILAIVAAVTGDSVGYEVGRLFGPRILETRPLRKKTALVDVSRGFLRRWGGWAVFLGRYTAFLRAMVPGLAGMSGMAYPRFLLANATGGITWASAFTLLGYFLGTAYTKVESASSLASEILLGLLIVAAVALWLRRRSRERKLDRATTSDGDADPGPLTVDGT